MALPQSHAWGSQLTAIIAIGESATVPTPGFTSPETYDTEKAQVVHRDVLRADQFSLVWAGDFASVAVTNQTDADWQPTDTLYVTVDRHPVNTGDVAADIEALNERIDALESDVATNTTNIGANTTAIGNNSTNIGKNASDIALLTARVTALENASSASQAASSHGNHDDEAPKAAKPAKPTSRLKKVAPAPVKKSPPIAKIPEKPGKGGKPFKKRR
jgi:uncharacterized coiled-coil protein SlyX